MTARPDISRLGQISLAVSDLERGKEFYRDRVGLRLLFEVPNMAFFDCGGVRLMMTLPEAGGTVENSVLYFLVDDIEASHRVMAADGVDFVREPHLLAKMPDHELWMAFFHDSEGNLMALMCEKRE
jgi:methylmalonyl-CoA/ethylmalonyl-CoA epimerase